MTDWAGKAVKAFRNDGDQPTWDGMAQLLRDTKQAGVDEEQRRCLAHAVGCAADDTIPAAGRETAAYIAHCIEGNHPPPELSE